MIREIDIIKEIFRERGFDSFIEDKTSLISKDVGMIHVIYVANSTMLDNNIRIYFGKDNGKYLTVSNAEYEYLTEIENEFKIRVRESNINSVIE